MEKTMTRVDSEFEKVHHPVVNNLLIHLSELMNVRPHSHRDFEIIMVLAGEIHVKTMTEDFVLREKEVAFFPRYMPHSCAAMEGANTIIAIQIDPAFCESYFPQIELLTLDSCNLEAMAQTDEQKKGLEEIKRVCFHMAYNYFLQRNGFEFRCMSDTNRLFACLLHSLPHHFLSETEAYTAIKTEARMQRILKYIDLHYTEKISLGEIAEREKLSVPYLSYMFRQYLNQTFQEYIKMLRFEKALLLLKNTDLKIFDICVECGISDPKYLNGMIQNTYHTTPTNFRRMNMDRQDTPIIKGTLPNEEKIFTFEESIELLEHHHNFMCTV